MSGSWIGCGEKIRCSKADANQCQQLAQTRIRPTADLGIAGLAAQKRPVNFWQEPAAQHQFQRTGPGFGPWQASRLRA